MELDTERQQGLPGSEPTATDSQVLQDPEMLLPDHSGQLWRLPLKPVPATKYSQLTTVHGLKHPKTLQYHHCCLSIAKAWKTTNSKAWLPENLRKDTPYSFALLHHLTIFARRTAGRRKHAHKILTQVWLDRQTQDLSFDHSDEAKLKFTPLPTKWQLEGPEPEAQECLDGLCSSDLLAAMEIADDEIEAARLHILKSMTAEAAEAKLVDNLELLDEAAIKQLNQFARKYKKRLPGKVTTPSKAKVQKKKKTGKKKVKMAGRSSAAKAFGDRAIGKTEAIWQQQTSDAAGEIATVGQSFELPIRGL